YRGLALDNNILMLSVVYVARRHLPFYPECVYALQMVLAGLNVSQFEMTKPKGAWYYVLILFCTAVTVTIWYQYHGQ
ncbi:hypothetical protein KIPB_012620, partial [Kipferlia bialata]